LEKTRYFPTLIRGEGGIRDTAQVSQLLLAGIVDLDELILHLATLRKFKSNAEDWVRELNDLLEYKDGMKDQIMKAVTKIKKLQNVIKKYIYY